MKKYIKADKFFFPYKVKKEGFLEIENGKFGDYVNEIPLNANVIDYSGYWIAPGLVDTHIHGFGGSDVMDNNLDTILGTMSEGLLEHGVTSWIPTPLTSNHNLLLDICENLGKHYKESRGAKIRGIFFEGPYFTEEHKGAQNTHYMTDPDFEEFEKWYNASNGLLNKIALAPERKGAYEFIQKVTGKGVVVALGHSNATMDEATSAVEAGASVWVHTFNGMSGFTHREPGMVGGALFLNNTYAEIICDGHHVDPRAVKILCETKGIDHIVLVTDAMRAAGMPDGEYMLGEFPVTVSKGSVHLLDGNSLAGSVLLLKNAMKNVVDWGVATPEEAIRMATLNPALSAKIDSECGQIKKQRDADFIVLQPNMEIRHVYLNGENINDLIDSGAKF